MLSRKYVFSHTVLQEGLSPPNLSIPFEIDKEGGEENAIEAVEEVEEEEESKQS